MPLELSYPTLKEIVLKSILRDYASTVLVRAPKPRGLRNLIGDSVAL
jgi:hypothetical protein